MLYYFHINSLRHGSHVLGTREVNQTKTRPPHIHPGVGKMVWVGMGWVTRAPEVGLGAAEGLRDLATEGIEPGSDP